MSTSSPERQDGGESITICTWNVNSINKRLPSVLRYLEEQRPDLVALQEIKCQDVNFPVEALSAAGYHAVFHGQKSYNGVAILSREPLTDVQMGLEGLDEAEAGDAEEGTEEALSEEEQEREQELGGRQARYMEGTLRGLKLCNLYLPNGNPVGTDKFTYRQQWTERLLARADSLLRTEVPFVLVGDFNLIPSDADCYSPTAMKDDAVTHPQCRQRFRALKYKGLYDALEAVHSHDMRGVYTYWGYRGNAWDRGHGIRIDHVMMEAAVADSLEGAGVHAHVRGWDTPSDHAPVWARLQVRW